jgi:hypothetical protein
MNPVLIAPPRVLNEGIGVLVNRTQGCHGSCKQVALPSQDCVRRRGEPA